MELSHKIAKVVRIVTVAPLLALGLLLGLWALRPGVLGGGVNLGFSILWLTVLPLLGYPLQPFLPGWKDKGREGQRKLAITMAVAGYVCSLVYGFIARIPKTLWLIFLTYFISGLGILLFNKVLHLMASGHACGVVGPVALFIYFTGGGWLLLLLPLLVYWASLKTDRHKPPELLTGSLIPIAAFGLSLVVLHLF